MKEVYYDFENCDVDCDECGHSAIIGSTDYTEINQELREEGWIIKCINGNWYEFCSMSCYRKFMSER